MTDASKIKKKIRARAQKTGESYSAARRQVLAKLDAERQAKTQTVATQAAAAPATGAVSEERCVEKTGHGFAHWFAVLDRFGGRKAGHTATARHLREEHGVSAWYSQSITVAYERAHGLREVGQLCTGDFQTSASRVLPVSTAMAVARLHEDSSRAIWLAPFDGEPAAALGEALAEKALSPARGGYRLRYRPEGPGGKSSVVELEVRDKADGRSTLVVRHTKIPERETMEELRASWRLLLDSFREGLES